MKIKTKKGINTYSILFNRAQIRLYFGGVINTLFQIESNNNFITFSGNVIFPFLSPEEFISEPGYSI